MPPRTVAILQALLVTFLWSTSWVLIKTGLDEIPALTFAGLRYVLAFLCLLPLALRPAHRTAIRSLTGSDWRQLAILGLVFYACTQGAQFLSLVYLPAQTASLVLSFSPVAVALIGVVALGERTVAAQWFGVGVFLVGAAVFLYPIPGGQALGLVIAIVGLASNAAAAVIGRRVNRGHELSPVVVTVVSMGIGSVALLVTGVVTQGLPALSAQGWLIVAWLAIVNTAFAFTLWNHTQRTLSALESSVVANTMLIQIAVLAWLFLDESLGPRKITGLVLAATGALIVQLRGLPVRRARWLGSTRA